MDESIAYWTDLLVRRRRLVIQVAVAIFAVVAIGTLLWPPTYKSTAKILVQDQRAQYLVSPDLQEDSVAKQAILARPVTQEDLNSEIELLTSGYLIRQVIADLRPPNDSVGATSALINAAGIVLDLPTIGYNALHQAPNLTSTDSWALKLERNLHPEVVKLSDVIEVSFDSHDPRWSHEFLTRLINEYLEYHAGLSSDPEAEAFFRKQSQLLEKKLNASEDAMRQFEIQNGITDIKAQKQALVARLSDLNGQNNRVGARFAAAQEQVTNLTEQLQQTPQRVDKEVKSVQDQALAQLKPQVMQLKAERAELLSRYQPTSQRIEEIDAKLAAAQRILDAENHMEVQEKSSDINPIWQSLATDLDKAKTSVAANQATLTALRGEIQTSEADLTKMTNDALTFTRLQRQVSADKEAYLSYVRKSEEARTAHALNMSKILNVSIAQPASMPLRPTFPVVWLNLLVGFVVAVAAGVAAAFWEEERDDIIYTPSAIDLASGLKTVAVFREES